MPTSNDQKILAVRYAAGPASTWKEYLRLSKRIGKTILDVCQYEVLAEADNFENTDGEFDLPASIDGKKVIEVEDGYVVGGELQRCRDWELCLDNTSLASILVGLNGQFVLDSEAMEALVIAVPAKHLVLSDDATAEEVFAWQKSRERQGEPRGRS